MTRLPHTEYYQTIRRARNSNGKGDKKKVLESYTILNHTSKNGKMHTIDVGNTRSN